MEIKISVRDLIEWLSTGWADWAGSVGFGWTCLLDPKTKACWATPAIRMILLHGESCNFSTTLPNMADSWKVYAFRSYHGRLRASTAVARGSSTGDTNRGNLLLNLMANKSILGRCHLQHIEWKTSGRRNHSVWVVWPSLDSLSATTFSWPGICRALESLLHSRAQSGPDLMPPSLLTYDTSTILFEQRSWNSFKARKTALSHSLYAACFPEGTRFLLQCARLSERPTLLLMHLQIFAEHVLLGVMVGL